MKLREQHKLLGIALLLPFMAWSATGLFFLIRPAYEQAYEPLAVRQYALEQAPKVSPQPDWRELRWMQSVLGALLLVRREGSGWVQLDPVTLRERPWPAEADLRTLAGDAISANPARYGQLVTIDGRRMTTDTGVAITFDWNTLSFTQQGRDTRWIDQVYSIHYLEWTGIAAVDKVLGVTGLLLLMYMTFTGFRLVFGLDRSRARPAAIREQA